MKRPFLLGFAVLVLAGTFFSLAALGPRRTGNGLLARPMMGFPAPSFTLRSLSGQRVSLHSLRGGPVLINFWATWCVACRAEMPQLQKFHEREGDQVTILGVDMREPAPTVQSYVQAGGYTWTFLLDSTGAVANAYHIRYVPTSFFLDARGVIRQVYTGPMDLGQMESFLREAEAAH